MATKQNKTFAQRAKALIKQYKRADFDPTEKAELEAALGKLAEEQEAYKQANNIGEYKPQQFANGVNDLDQASTNWYGEAPMTANTNNGMYGSNMIGQVDVYGYPNTTKESLTIEPWMTDDSAWGFKPTQVADPLNEPLKFTFANEAPSVPNTVNPTYSPYGTSIVPSLIGAGVEGLGNLYLANMAKKSAEASQIDPTHVQPNLVNLSQARESARRDYNTAENIAKRNLRTAGSRGAYMSGVGAATTGLTRAKEQAISDLYAKEGFANQQARTNASNLNAQYASQADMINMQNRLRGDAEQQAYLSAAIGTIPQTMRDIIASRQRDAEINLMGQDYGIGIDPTRKWYQNQRYVKTLNKNIR